MPSAHSPPNNRYWFPSTELALPYFNLQPMYHHISGRRNYHISLDHHHYPTRVCAILVKTIISWPVTILPAATLSNILKGWREVFSAQDLRLITFPVIPALAWLASNLDRIPPSPSDLKRRACWKDKPVQPSLRVPECFVQDDRPAGHVSWRDGERGLLLVSCLVNGGKLEESSGEQLH